MLDALGVLQSRGAVKKVQYGTVTVAASATSGTATITSVVIGKSVLIMLGSTFVAAANAITGAVDWHRITLTNSTTVTANTGGATNIAGTTGFVVVEFW